jgi:hypothetical protein
VQVTAHPFPIPNTGLLKESLAMPPRPCHTVCTWLACTSVLSERPSSGRARRLLRGLPPDVNMAAIVRLDQRCRNVASSVPALSRRQAQEYVDQERLG